MAGGDRAWGWDLRVSESGRGEGRLGLVGWVKWENCRVYKFIYMRGFFGNFNFKWAGSGYGGIRDMTNWCGQIAYKWNIFYVWSRWLYSQKSIVINDIMNCIFFVNNLSDKLYVWQINQWLISRDLWALRKRRSHQYLCTPSSRLPLDQINELLDFVFFILIYI